MAVLSRDIAGVNDRRPVIRTQELCVDGDWIRWVPSFQSGQPTQGYVSTGMLKTTLIGFWIRKRGRLRPISSLKTVSCGTQFGLLDDSPARLILLVILRGVDQHAQPEKYISRDQL
jgi:hypothetical protein